MGKTENLPVYIGIFAQENVGDVAVQGFISKLKKYLLPQIRSGLSGLQLLGDLELEASDHWESVHFKYERIYKHNILQGEDIIHVNTWKQNVMVLNPAFTTTNGQHPFWYAQTSSGWGARHLDRITFPLLAEADSFGFLDLANDVWACHIIPQFFGGKGSHETHGMSRLVEDIQDWDLFVDRDMVMRYLWGSSVGHVYSHRQELPHQQEGRNEEDKEMIADAPPDHHGKPPIPGIHLADILPTLESIEQMDQELDDVEEGFSSDASEGWGTDSDSNFESEDDDSCGEADFEVAL
ncbi:hypothetical protein DXG01_006101 [Tephrocybe rancida]|nr:hypothetical protein DXG01_006101 [Tephrocybe rancida]